MKTFELTDEEIKFIKELIFQARARVSLSKDPKDTGLLLIKSHFDKLETDRLDNLKKKFE